MVLVVRIALTPATWSDGGTHRTLLTVAVGMPMVVGAQRG